MQYCGIYAITDDKLLAPDSLLPAVEVALNAGIAMLQYRCKTADAATRLQQASALQALCAQHKVPLIINDDVELCAAVGAAGVHLGRQDTNLGAARKLLGRHAIIGVTCHNSLDAASTAARDGANYVAFGRFFPSHTKPQASPADLSLLQLAQTRLNIPIVAIGGINAENGAALRDAGADMLAVVHAIFGSNDIHSSTRALVALYQPHISEKQQD